MAVTNNPTISETEYMSVINSKTAALFVAAAELGAVVGNRPEEERQALKDFGENLGIVFQLVDDALDYHGEASKLGKDVGDDFREGKITLPVILAYQQGTKEEQDFWKRTLGEGNIEDQDLETAIQLTKKYKTIEETMNRARSFGEKAKTSLSHFPNNDWSEALQDVIEFCIERGN